jgi:hypothetical protein
LHTPGEFATPTAEPPFGAVALDDHPAVIQQITACLAWYDSHFSLSKGNSDGGPEQLRICSGCLSLVLVW